MRFLLFSPIGLVAVLGLLWTAKVLQSLPSDWQQFQETEDRNQKLGQIFVWASALIAGMISCTIMFGLLTTSLSELESWKRF